MKLSNKLFILIPVILLGIITYQCYITKKVIPDMATLYGKTPSAELYQTIEGLNSYKKLSPGSFSSIVTEGVYVNIIKGERFEVFYSPYFNLEVKKEGDKLKIKNKAVEKRYISDVRSCPVFVFMPEEPDSITVYNNRTMMLHFYVQGFSGAKTQFYFQPFNTSDYVLSPEVPLYLYTDMQELNIRMYGNTLRVIPLLKDSNSSLKEMNLNVHAESSNFTFFGYNKLEELNADIHINSSNINLEVPEIKHIETIKLQGIIKEDNQNWIGERNYSEKLLFSQCDSLIVDLRNLPGNYQLEFAADTSGIKYKSIQVDE